MNLDDNNLFPEEIGTVQSVNGLVDSISEKEVSALWKKYFPSKNEAWSLTITWIAYDMAFRQRRLSHATTH